LAASVASTSSIGLNAVAAVAAAATCFAAAVGSAVLARMADNTRSSSA